MRLSFFDKDPSIKKVTTDIYTFYKYNSFLMYPMIVWYILGSVPQISSHFPKGVFIAATVLMFLLDIAHVFLMALVLRRERHSQTLRQIEPKIIILRKNGKQRSNPVRLRYWVLIPIALYTIGATILILTFLLQINAMHNVDLKPGDTTGKWLLSNVMSTVGLVVSIIRIVVNRKSKRHAEGLMKYVEQHPELDTTAVTSPIIPIQ